MIDLHTHVWQYPDHLTRDFADEASRAWGRTIETNPGLHVTPETHWQAFANAPASRVVVLAFRSRWLGVDVPNEHVARYVAQHPDRLVGFACVDPADPDPAGELEHAIRDLGLKGLKLAPIYQNFHPMDRRVLPVYEKAQRLGVPVLFHQGTTFARRAPLKFAHPEQLEEVAMAFPDLRFWIAHMGHPWELETIVLIRKQPNVFADVSGLHPRPWQLYNTLRLAIEYGVTDKLLFGTDYPFFTIEQTVRGLRATTDVARRAHLPEVPGEMIDQIIERDSLGLLEIDCTGQDR